MVDSGIIKKNRSKKSAAKKGEEKDLCTEVISIKRVAKIVRGGTNFSFLVCVIVGDKEGKIGIASGKDKELNNAKIKACRAARKNMVHVNLYYARTIHHDCTAKYNSSIVVMRSAKIGSGLIAGGPLRRLCECIGIKDIVIKVYGSRNVHNVVRAALECLLLVSNPRKIAERRGMKVNALMAQKKVCL